MSTPVRTLVLNKLVDVLGTVPELKAVVRFHPAPEDVNGIRTPALYLFEISPEDRSYSNRDAVGKMHLLGQVYIELSMLDSKALADFHDLSDVIEARLHNIYYGNHGLASGIVKIVEGTYERLVTQDGWGMLNSQFEVEYRHDFGNAFR